MTAHEVPRPGPRRPGFGVLLPTLDALHEGLPPMTREARRIEAAGFDSAWVGDHLVFHSPYREAFVSLSAAAAATNDITVGIGVLQSVLRPFAWTAKQITTMQDLHRDRMLLGVGLGGENPEEWAAAGVALRGRGPRLDSHLANILAATTGQGFVADGHDVPALSPHGAAPPVWVGGRSEAALRRAALLSDGYLGLWLDEASVRRTRTRLDELGAAGGRPPVALGLNIVTTVGRTREEAEASADAYLRGVFGRSIDQMRRWIAVGEPDEVADRLRGLREAGVTDVVCLPGVPALRYSAQVDALAGVRESVWAEA